MAKVSLVVDGQVFVVNKEVLCEHSDYFRAMFSGHYLENDKQEFSLNVIGAESIKIILEYMKTGLCNLQVHSLSSVKELAAAATFLQITALMNQIEYILSSKEISPENCMQIMTIAENSAFTQLEQQCANYALLSFRSMKPEYIPDITRLCWYLSHTYLDTQSELDIFHFGLMWISQNETTDDALLMVLGCLDINKLTLNNLLNIRSCLSYNQNQNSLAADVTECLQYLAEVRIDLSVDLVQLGEKMPKELYTERVYNETMNLIKESRSRLPTYTLVVPLATSTQELKFYTFTEDGFENWITLNVSSPSNLHGSSALYDRRFYNASQRIGMLQGSSRYLQKRSLMGWNVVAWGLTKLVVFVCTTNRRSLKVYDVLKEEWTCHDTTFNCGREESSLNHNAQPTLKYACGQVIGDSLYLITCSDENTTIYDLKTRTFATTGVENRGRKLITAVCAHEGSLYAAVNLEICKHEACGSADAGCWRAVVEAGFLVTSMASFKGFIYCTQSHSKKLYRFRPGVDDKLHVVTCLTSPPMHMCNMGNRLLFFTVSRTEYNAMNVEEYYSNTPQETPRVVWYQKPSTMAVDDIMTCCPLVMTIPPLNCDTSNYVIEYLKKYRKTRGFYGISSNIL